MKDFKKMLLTLLCSYLIIGLCWISKDIIIHENNKDGLPVLGYHGVVSDQEKQNHYQNNPYFLSQSQFDQQMKYLAQNNYQCLTMQDVEDYYRGNKKIAKKAVCLTFDDGYLNFNTVVKPIIKKYNLHATCFVIGYKVKHNKAGYLHQADIKNDQYVSYYSHSYNLHHFARIHHLKKIETLSTEEIKKDFDTNIVSNQYFAFPYGVSSQNAQSYLKNSSTHLAFSYNQNRNMTRADQQYLLPRYLMFDKMPFFYYKWIIE
ncbi:polysaccharide deacetylase family protein [Erysipelatoclostridium sp. AM42-17]|uniref:polysaccharide deacetylase family protein n=1 Tax=Erysipelatoclostridium sp. AM42-17 TaxID=2293102 RepID=UPI000E4F9D79|nr:polysaccharide deacetylase family protein [Erysipelatoclostridium sp. AM42-17]RHS93710.1 polysaccharide deacetylase [Erysipelatoclostridium sp. AM42-17]